jgi:hypothetical protein
MKESSSHFSGCSLGKKYNFCSVVGGGSISTLYEMGPNSTLDIWEEE